MMRTSDSSQAAVREEPPGWPTENRLVLLIALVALFVATLTTFLNPHINGDTFMTLAGGRDVADGKLAAPDDWSFASENRVWINQSWLTGLLFYKLWSLLGPEGLLAYKAVMLTMTCVFLVLSARQFRVGLGVSVLTIAYIMASSADTVGLRANLLGLTMLSILIWLLFVSYHRPHRIWWAVGLLTLWAQLHGSFIFGIAVLGLWTVINYLLPRWQGRKATTRQSRKASRRQGRKASKPRSGKAAETIPRWPFLAAVVAASVLAVVTSPYGITNLTQPFTLMGFFLPEKWPGVNREMTPILNDYPEIQTFVALPWYLFMLGALAAPLVLRVTGPTDDIPRIADLGHGRRTIWLFSLALAAITVAMTLCARRFLPVCLIVCAPLLAFEAQWVLSHRRYAWPAVLATVIAFAIGFALERILVCVMHPNLIADSPAPPSVLRWAWGIAALILAFSSNLGFLLANRFSNPIAGAKADERESRGWLSRLWDGQYLAWTPLAISSLWITVVLQQLPGLLDYYRLDSPRIPNYDVFGRMVGMGAFPEAGANFLNQNNITGNTLNDWKWEGYLHWIRPELKLMVGGRSRQVYSPRAVTQWKTAMRPTDHSIHPKMGIQLAVLPCTDPLAMQPFTDQQTPWRIIFYDDLTVIAATTDDPQSRQLLADAQSGLLRYPSERTSRYTVAARKLAAVSDSHGAEILKSVAAATSEHPALRLYQLLLDQQRSKRVPLRNIVSFFEAELSRLHEIDYHRAEGFAYLESRQLMANTVANYYAKLPEHTETALERRRILFWRQYAKECGAAGIALLNGSPDTDIREIPKQFAPS